jgi:hypothetical protein
MSRCKACDVILTNAELNKTYGKTDTMVGMCYDCSKISTKAYTDFDATVDTQIDFTVSLDEFEVDRGYN